MAKIQLTLEQKQAVVAYLFSKDCKGILDDKPELWPGIDDDVSLFKSYRTAISEFIVGLHRSACTELTKPEVDPAAPPPSAKYDPPIDLPLFTKELIQGCMAYWPNQPVADTWSKIRVDGLSPVVVSLSDAHLLDGGLAEVQVVALGLTREYGQVHVLGLYQANGQQVLRKIVELVSSTPDCYIAVDSTGVGVAIAEKLKSDIRLPASKLIQARYVHKPGSPVAWSDLGRLSVNKLGAMRSLALMMQNKAVWLPKHCDPAFDLLNYWTHRVGGDSKGQEIVNRKEVEPGLTGLGNLLVLGHATLLAIKDKVICNKDSGNA